MAAPTNNSLRIAELQDILAGGESSVTNDGVTVQYDLDQVREELNRLRRTDASSQLRRPRLSSVNISRLRS